jgi:hypothetical protein
MIFHRAADLIQFQPPNDFNFMQMPGPRSFAFHADCFGCLGQQKTLMEFVTAGRPKDSRLHD